MTNKKPLIIAVAAVAVVAAIIGVLFATGILGGGGIARAATLNAANIISSDSKTSSAELGKLVEVDIDALDNVNGVELYATSQDMADFVESTYDDVMSGELRNASSVDDLMSADQAKKLNGQWVVGVVDNELLLSPVASNLVYSMTRSNDIARAVTGIEGESAVMATVIADKELTSEKFANVIDSAGVKYDHVVIDTKSIDDVEDYVGKLGGIPFSQLENYGVEGAGIAVFWGENQFGFAVSIQCEDYAVIALYVANSADYGITPDMLKGVYIK